jgi:hypothetical protein
MKRIKLIFLTFLVFGSLAIQAQQTAPITTAGSITNAVPGTVTVPVTVSNFYNIGAISLKLTYDINHLQFVSLTTNPSVYLEQNGTGGNIILSGFNMTGESLPDGTVLFNVTFLYSGGSSALAWIDDGASCEYATIGVGDALPDTPQSTYYIDGVITDHPAPVTTAPLITNAVPGTISPAITVTNFTSVGKIALKLEYDASVLSYVSSVPNAAFSGGLTISDVAGSGNIRYIVFARSASTGVTLADNAILATLNFTYSNSTAGFCHLNWIDDGTSCQYSDPSDVPMVDKPKSIYYIDGMVSSQVAPVTQLPVNLTAVPGPVWVPVTVNGFTNIKSLSLKFEYNTQFLTYLNSSPNVFVPNGSLAGLSITNTIAGATGTIEIMWSSGSPVTLTAGSTIVNIPFLMENDTAYFSNLKWVDNGTSCEYKDTYLNPLYDLPLASYYTNGVVSMQPSPEYDIEDIYVGGAQAVNLTVKVKQFSNIGSVTLDILYDPASLTSPTVTANPVIGGIFNTGTTSSGKITISWIGSSALTLPDNSTFCTLGFTFNGTPTIVTFHDDGQSCLTTGPVPSKILYDLPQSTYYKNGLVGIGTIPVLNVKAFLEGAYAGSGTMSTNLNSPGIMPLTQPYNTAPWNYTGTESVASIPAGVTDWVLLEFRSGTAANTMVARKACFIKNNGMIVALDGTSLPTLTGMTSGSFYIVIKHRNHLAVMTSSAVSLSPSSALYDFSTAQSQVYGGATKNLGSGVYGLYSGDANADNTVQISDYNILQTQLGSTNGYYKADFTLDKTVQISDYNKWSGNAGNSSTVPN